MISRNINAGSDYMHYSLAVKDELLGNYSSALNKYQQVVQLYQDSIIARNALKKLLYCNDRMNADSNSYATLRNYYRNLISSNLEDTAFIKVAEELATKTLVRKKHYESAIGEYENVILNSQDSLEILSAELNIIETYLIMTQQGSWLSSQFIGQFSNLRPAGITEGIRMINERLHRLIKKSSTVSIPQKYELSQNYPNPFNAITKIKYALPKPDIVSLKVYDVLGRLVKELINGYKDAGYWEVEFDGTNLSSGVYFYRLETGAYTQTRKMLLVK